MNMEISVTHSFDVEIAVIVGERAAVIYKNLKFWISLNQKKGHNIRDGRAWVHFSISELATYFPYLTEKQVRTACYKLKAAGLVDTANYNQWANDHTTWFGLPILSDQTGKPVSQSVSPVDQTGKPAAQMGKALPDSNPDSNPNTDPDINPAHPFDRKTQGIPQPIVNQIERISKLSGRKMHIQSLMLPVDEAISMLGQESVAEALRGVADSYENPRQDREKIPRQLIPLLRSPDRMLDWASRCKSSEAQNVPDYLSNAEGMRRLVDIKRRIGQQLTPQEIEACKQHQIAYA